MIWTPCDPIIGPHIPECPNPLAHRWRYENNYDHHGLSVVDDCIACRYYGFPGDNDAVSIDIIGTLEFVPECDNLGGWHGVSRCDCGWQYLFHPDPQSGGAAMTGRLVGVQEVTAILGVTRQRVVALVHDKPGFPEPLVRLACGPVWACADIEAWKTTWDRRPGRPRKEQR